MYNLYVTKGPTVFTHLNVDFFQNKVLIPVSFSNMKIHVHGFVTQRKTTSIWPTVMIFFTCGIVWREGNNP